MSRRSAKRLLDEAQANIVFAIDCIRTGLSLEDLTSNDLFPSVNALRAGDGTEKRAKTGPETSGPIDPFRVPLAEDYD